MAKSIVTPFAGVWIEIKTAQKPSRIMLTSPPSRGCGLKFLRYANLRKKARVTPFAGVWIEILADTRMQKTT